MKRFLLTSLAAAVVLQGCLSYQQHIKLNADGSGSVTVDAWVDDFSEVKKNLEETLESEGGSAETAAPEPETPQELTIPDEFGNAFKNLEGITIVENWIKYEPPTEPDKNGRNHTRLVLTFDNLSRLNGHGVFRDQELSVKTKKNKTTFTHIIHNDIDKEAKKAQSDEEWARALFADYKFTYSVEMPGKVTETNGTVGPDGRTVTWSWPLIDFSRTEKITMKAVYLNE